MPHTSTKIIFFGNERLVSGLKHADTPVLNGLIERGYKIEAIVSHHSDSKSRNQRDLEVAHIARMHHIPLHLPNKPSEILPQLAEYKADIAVLVAYGRIIPQDLIDIFPKGILNIHPSLLPAYRGPTPIESAILHGDPQTGVSLMQLTAGMDSGPIYGQTLLPLTGKETKFDVYKSLSHQGASLLFDLLPAILEGNLKPEPQNEANATYSRLFKKEDALLDPQTTTAIEAERRVRAHLGFPKTKITLRGHSVIITKAHISATPETPTDLLCSDGIYLVIDELISPSGRPMDAEAFLRGYAAKS